MLFLRFLLSLVDESEKIRQLADYLFGNILKGYTDSSTYQIFLFKEVADVFSLFLGFDHCV